MPEPNDHWLGCPAPCCFCKARDVPSSVHHVTHGGMREHPPTKEDAQNRRHVTGGRPRPQNSAYLCCVDDAISTSSANRNTPDVFRAFCIFPLDAFVSDAS